jgi:hypothetical protein
MDEVHAAAEVGLSVSMIRGESVMPKEDEQKIGEALGRLVYFIVRASIPGGEDHSGWRAEVSLNELFDIVNAAGPVSPRVVCDIAAETIAAEPQETPVEQAMAAVAEAGVRRHLEYTKLARGTFSQARLTTTRERLLSAIKWLEEEQEERLRKGQESLRGKGAAPA